MKITTPLAPQLDKKETAKIIKLTGKDNSVKKPPGMIAGISLRLPCNLHNVTAIFSAKNSFPFGVGPYLNAFKHSQQKRVLRLLRSLTTHTYIVTIYIDIYTYIF